METKKIYYISKNIAIGNGNNAVVIGYNTFLSLNKKPLKNRFNYVLTSNHFNDFICDINFPITNFENYKKILENNEIENNLKIEYFVYEKINFLKELNYI